MKDINKVNKGKKSRKDGKAFENLVRKDLMSKGYIVCRWDNQVEFGNIIETPNKKEIIKQVKKGVKKAGFVLESNIEIRPIGRLVQAKAKFNPFTKRVMNMSAGFPDFICIKPRLPNVLLVECKMNGKLDKLEKQKIEWIKQNLKIPVHIAKKDEKEIKYEEK